MHLGNRFRELRKQKGMRQKEVATLLGYKNEDLISHWEKGQVLPGMTNLFKLAKIYGVLPHELYLELFEQS